MNLEFTTRQLDAQPILGIRTSAGKDELAQTMGPLFQEIHGYIRQNGHAPAGKPLAIYYSMGEAIDHECAVPVASSIAGTERIRVGALPAGKVATVTHVGPYEGLPQTWSALSEWMQSQGLAPAGAPWEVYVTNPAAEPDLSQWRTDIFFPVR